MRLVRFAGSFPLMISASLAAQPAALQPTTKWVVNYADDLCTLERNYGAADKPLALALQPEVMGQGQRFILVTGMSGPSFSNRKISFTADGKEVPIEGKAYTVSLVRDPWARHGFELTNEAIAQIRNAAVLSIDGGPGLRFQFAVPGLSKALVALEACRSDLVSGWGMSPAQQAALAIPAAPLQPLYTYFKTQDFPRRALGKSGRTRVRLTIDEAGMASRCAVVRSAGNLAFDQQSCAVLQQRARFKPAQDRAGRPMSSFHIAEIAWITP